MANWIWKKYNATPNLTYSWRQYNTSTSYSGWERIADIQTVYFSSGDLYSLLSGHRSITINSSTGRISGVGNQVEIGNVGTVYRYISGNEAQYVTNTRSGSRYLCTFYKIASKGTTTKGTHRGTVTSTSSAAYPTNGQSGSYWYDTRTSSTSYSQGSYIGEVIAEDGTYPTNGRASDGYWYVRSEMIPPTIYKNQIIKSIKYKDQDIKRIYNRGNMIGL